MQSFVISAFMEEFMKWFLMYFLIYKHVEFDELFDGIVYAVAVAAGFATVENLFYIFLVGGNVISLIWTRAFLPVSAHALFGVTMGYYYAKSKISPRIAYLGLSILIPVLFHGVFNYINYTSTNMASMMLVLFMGFLWWFNIKKMNTLLDP